MQTCYLYRESDVFTVGFYGPDGRWVPSSDWATEEEAAKRVHYLNGGNVYEFGQERERIKALCMEAFGQGNNYIPLNESKRSRMFDVWWKTITIEKIMGT